MEYISTKLYTNLVNSQSFQIIQVKLMTFDLLQGHMIQYGHQTLFQSAKISMLLTISPKILEIFAHLLFFCYSPVLNYRIKKKYISTFIWLQDPVK